MSGNSTPLAAALADRYRIERELGAGGMATVYLAEDVRHHRKVAVKVLRPELAASMGPDRFLREIEIAAQLQHPHILPLLDSGDAAGFLFYVMPYVQGESLRDRLVRERELPVHDALRIISEVADALAHAHERGVVHRDIKPENILLSGRHALVADFGVAKAVSEASGRLKLTSVGVALGTPTYMAPEQASADPGLDHRVDIYALGVVAYELLAGRPPFTGHTAQEVLAAHMTRPPEPIRNFRGNVAPAVEAIVLRCLEKHPADRWQSTSELVSQLEPLATPSGGMTPTTTRPIPSAVPAHGLPRWLAWALGGALVAGGALALTLTQRAPNALVIGKRTAVAVSAEWESWPSLSPDGKTVTYASAGPRTSGLFVQQIDGGSPVRLGDASTGWSSAGQISPDGTKILFLARDGLSLMPALGGQVRLVAAGDSRQGEVLWGGWAPDSKRIVYSDRDTLFAQSLDGPGRTALTSGIGVHSPAWSPDGRWVAFVDGNPEFYLNGNTASCAIRLVPVAGGAVVSVTEANALNISPIWIPGQRALLFISDREGGRDIYQVSLRRDGTPAGRPVRITTGLNPERLSISADGTRLAWSVYTETSNVWSIPVPMRDSLPLSQAQQITTGSQNIETISVSADGAWLYFDSNRGGSMDLWRQPLAGGPPQRLTTDSTDEFNPSISPDGREIAFHSFRDGHRSVFVMPAAGGRPTQVSTSRGDNRVPHWAPDGRRLLWVDGFAPDSALFLARRKDGGSWEPPVLLITPGITRTGVRWTPDGKGVGFGSRAGIELLDLASGTRRLLIPELFTSWWAWAADGKTVYGVAVDSLGRLLIGSAAIGGKRRVLVYADDPLAQVYRYGFAMHGGRFYVPVVERKEDVWVGEVETSQ